MHSCAGNKSHRNVQLRTLRVEIEKRDLLISDLRKQLSVKENIISQLAGQHAEREKSCLVVHGDIVINLNCFGKEKPLEIDPVCVQRICRVVSQAVPKYVELKHFGDVSTNANIRIRDRSRGIVEVVNNTDGILQWKTKTNLKEILHLMYERNYYELISIIEEIMKGSAIESNMKAYHHRVLTDADTDSRRRYREQVNAIEEIILNAHKAHPKQP
jgi:hypothetical protein